MNVVIIDDDGVILMLMEHLVRKLEGCRAIGFTDSVAALEWCEQQHPDLVIIDYMMPNMDGLEFIRRFRKFEGSAETPILMITASHQREVCYQALEQGFTDFLSKPVDGKEFLARTRNMLALSVSRKQLASRTEWLAAEVRKATAEILGRERETVFRLCRTVDYRDQETGAHIVRVAEYAKHIAENLGLSSADQETVVLAAPMHDIGKVGIPDRILTKPGRFNEAELQIMRKHSLIGYEMLKDSPAPALQAAATIARSHHEKYDGSGYPFGLKGEAIPLFGRICAVADVFDALTCERPYKKAWKAERAAHFIRNATGRHFDPDCVEAFFRNWDTVLEIKQSCVDQE